MWHAFVNAEDKQFAIYMLKMVNGTQCGTGKVWCNSLLLTHYLRKWFGTIVIRLEGIGNRARAPYISIERSAALLAVANWLVWHLAPQKFLVKYAKVK